MRSDPDAPSRTARKKASAELQDIGKELLELRPNVLAALPLPETLQEAIVEAKRLTSFEAQRRQAQFIGKLMRRLEPEVLEAVRTALRAEHGLSAADARLLHRAEQWRDSLIADDTQFARWLEEFPDSDAQQLRGLIRDARKQAVQGKPGGAPRKGSAYRRIFAIVRSQLRSAGH